MLFLVIEGECGTMSRSRESQAYPLRYFHQDYEVRLISAASYLEAGIVVDNQIGAAAGRQLDALIARAGARVEAVTREHADIARQAYLDFGKGNHPPRLNFGDCLAYALSKSTDFPLLFKGDDFSKSDVASALDDSHLSHHDK